MVGRPRMDRSEVTDELRVVRLECRLSDNGMTLLSRPGKSFCSRASKMMQNQYVKEVARFLLLGSRYSMRARFDRLLWNRATWILPESMST